MKAKKTYAVFGLGRYGIAVARELVENGMEVIAVDTDEKIVNDAAAYLPVCKCADVTDAEVVSRLGIGNIDTVIVCMASSLEASVMAVALCKEAGVKTVIAKCSNEMQQKILLLVGADQVVFPENESGVRLAKNLLSSGFIDVISLSKDASIVEIDVKEEWCGKNLIELNLRKKYGFNIIAIKKDGKVNVNINPEQVLDSESSLIVIANTAKLGKLK
ncbi:MAG: TrkA family potassium uptake protein [Clostridia bacterium]|nr:TrkA family potassium uptake protein [Clostridia bacterium]MBR2932787.1 TrkA family potassium uptake protein [Clostridia bacterium]MBR6687766.1 TrkA family potassium uptake protein [Clostridia bacterium]